MTADTAAPWAGGQITPRARCVLANQYDEVVYVYYGGMTEVTVERPPPATLAPPA